MIKPFATVPMQVSIMSPEDRTGRGSDHIPFRENGFTAMRFCSANEHGDGNVDDADYHDRQHTSDDILGVDTDGDLVIDSFFVDFDYLARNAVINGNGAAMAALGPESPTITYVSQNGDFLFIEINDPLDYNEYAVAMRTYTNDWDTLFYMHGVKSAAIDLANHDLNIFISVTSIDSWGIESLFSAESLVKITGTSELVPHENIELFQNKPNPADETTIISFWVQDPIAVHTAVVNIRNLEGKLIREIPVLVHEGMNEVLFDHGYNMTGTFLYTLMVNDQQIATRKMVFAN